MHSSLRPRLFAVSEHWLSDSQLGGHPRMGVDFASHAVKSFIDYLFMKKLAGLFFLCGHLQCLLLVCSPHALRM